MNRIIWTIKKAPDLVIDESGLKIEIAQRSVLGHRLIAAIMPAGDCVYAEFHAGK